MPIKEDAPANATGTAVAGTGDDSSTVVVKKKKKMQDKLMKRLGIKETLDRLVPDLEYTVDEITKRKNQLKAMAVAAREPPTTINKLTTSISAVKDTPVAIDDRKAAVPINIIPNNNPISVPRFIYYSSLFSSLFLYKGSILPSFNPCRISRT